MQFKDKKSTRVSNKATIVHNKGIIVCKKVSVWLDTIYGGAYEEEKTIGFLQ